MFLTNIRDIKEQKSILLTTLKNINGIKKPTIDDFFKELEKLDVVKKGEKKHPEKDYLRGGDYTYDKPRKKTFVKKVNKEERLKTNLVTVARAMMMIKDHPEAEEAGMYLYENANKRVRDGKHTPHTIIDRGLVWDETPYRDFYAETSHAHTPLGEQLRSNLRKLIGKSKPTKESYENRYYGFYHMIQRSPDTITGVLNAIDEIELLEEND